MREIWFHCNTNCLVWICSRTLVNFKLCCSVVSNFPRKVQNCLLFLRELRYTRTRTRTRTRTAVLFFINSRSILSNTCTLYVRVCSWRICIRITDRTFNLIVGGAKRSLAKNTGKLQGQWQQLVAAISGSANYQFVLVRSSTSSINKFKMRIALPLLSLKSHHILIHTCSCVASIHGPTVHEHVPPLQSCDLSFNLTSLFAAMRCVALRWAFLVLVLLLSTLNIQLRVA